MAFWNRRPRTASAPPRTAAIARVGGTLEENLRRVTRGSHEAWRIYREVGEIHYATQQQARLVGRLDWTMTVNGGEPEEADEVLHRVFGSGLRHLQQTMAVNLQVAGAFALARLNNEWRVLPFPLDHQNKKLAELADPLIAVETPDPQNGEPDSPVIASLPVARELLLARAQARAAARSRIAQTQVLLYPAEGAGPDPEEFERDFQQVLSAPLSDEQSVNVAMPNFIRWPRETIGEWRQLDLTGPLDEKLDERIDRLVRQLAIILDIPPSLLLGNADANHWTAWADAEDNFLGHVEPLAVPIGRALGQAIASLTQTDPDALVLTPDPAPLLRRRPTISDVLTAYQDGLVSAKWARAQLGATDDDAPTRRGETETTGEPGAEPSPASSEPSGGESQAQVEQATTAATRPAALDGARLADIDFQVSTSLTDLIDDTSDRIMERLGAVIRSTAQKRDIELPEGPNEILPRHYTGQIPNRDSIIDEEAMKAARRVDRIINRAYGRLRAMGLSVEPLRSELEAAHHQFSDAVRRSVDAKSEDKSGEEQAWLGAQMIAAVAAGADTMDALPRAASPTVAAARVGIASSPRVQQALKRDLDIDVGGYIWDHLYQGENPHPQHQSFDGREFDGESITEDGVIWSPGDHTGCACEATPQLVHELLDMEV